MSMTFPKERGEAVLFSIISIKYLLYIIYTLYRFSGQIVRFFGKGVRFSGKEYPVFRKGASEFSEESSGKTDTNI